MVLVLNGPYWFRGFESLFIFVAGIVTILIALLSYKAYRLSKEERYKYFGLSFLVLSLGFFVFSIFSSLLLTHLSTDLTNILNQFDYAFLVHILLSLVAYMILLIVVLKVKNKKIIALLISLILLFTVFSYQHYLKFHIVSFLLLFFLSYQFYSNYLKKKNPNAKLVFGSFYLLTCAEAFFIIGVYTGSTFHVVARVVQFLGFMALFYTLIRITNHGRKKRKA